MQYRKHAQQHHIQHHHNGQHFGVPRHHAAAAAQAVYLSPNPSNAGPQAPPIYYSAPPTYPHTPNSMVKVDDEYDSASAAGDGMNGEPNPYHRMQMQQPKYPTQQYHPHHSAGPYTTHPGQEAVYYSSNLPTPAVSPASSCSGPNLPPPAPQYSQGHHSPPTGHLQAAQHQPTPYQGGTPNSQHPQPIHYAAAYSGHRLYSMSADHVPRLHSGYTSSQNMPMGADGNPGLGINMNGAQPIKVDVSTPMAQAW